MGTFAWRAAAVLSLAATVGGIAEGQGQPGSPAPGAGVAVADAQRSAATVLGYIWTAESAPIPNAALRLRDLGTGRVRGTATSNENGEFAFAEVEGGSYVAEYVDVKGKVIAVGSAFSVAPGETVVTFVRLGSRTPLASGFFRSIAAAAVSSAASVGVTAVGTTGRPISPRQ